MLKPFLFAAAVFAAAVNVSPAFAKQANPTVRTVAYADLDLSTAAGRSRLERRIGATVRELCGEASSFDLARRHAVRDCIAETRANVQLPGPVAVQLAGTR